MSKARYLVKAYGDDKEAMCRAIQCGFGLLSEIDDLVIVVPSIQNMDHSMFAEYLRSIVPADQVKSFFKNRIWHLPGGKKIHLCAASTLKNFTRSQGYLLLWGMPQTIEAVEAIPSCRHIVELSWVEQDYANWVAKFKPKVV